MKYITYATEKKINEIKKIYSSYRTLHENIAVMVYDKIFGDCGMCGATLKEFEQYLGHRLDNKRQINFPYLFGIHGIEYETNGNLRYLGTNNLSIPNLNIEDFNLFVKNISIIK